jgi:hypothetical protein
MCGFAFFVDITQYVNDLNSSLQGMNQLTNEIFAKKKMRVSLGYGNSNYDKKYGTLPNS